MRSLNRLLLWLAFLSCLPTAFAQRTSDTSDFKGQDNEEVLPDIEAATYSVSVEKRSKSLRVYLFEQKNDLIKRASKLPKPGAPASSGPDTGPDDEEDNSSASKLPKPGKILLMTHNKENVMAFRILKKYPDRNQFAGSKVRIYSKGENLEIGDRYLAIEKLADLAIPEYTLHDQELDKFDLKDLESQMEPIPVQPYDPELDAGTSPPPGNNPAFLGKKRIKIDPEEDLEQIEVNEDEIEPLTPDEIRRFDNDWQWLTAGIGYFANQKANGETGYYTGGGLRYGATFGKYVFTKQAHLQDSFVFEFGLFYYTVIGYENPTDSYRILPLIMSIRYNLLLSESFGFFVYGGLLKNMVLSQSGGSDWGSSRLGGFGGALGGGMLFRLGPKWYLRTDLGLDHIGAGLTIRF